MPHGADEIIVVDDEPDRNTLQLVAGWRARTLERGPRLVYVANNGPHGPAAARNRGWRISRAPIIAFTDDDTVPSPGWLRHGLAGFDPHTDVLCGRIETPLPAMPTDYQRAACEAEAAEFVATNCFCRRGVLDALDGFDERFRSRLARGQGHAFSPAQDARQHRTVAAGAGGASAASGAMGRSLFQLHKIIFDALLYKKHPELYRQKIRRLPCWEDYAIVAAMVAGALGLAGGNEVLAVAGCGTWLVLTCNVGHPALARHGQYPSRTLPTSSSHRR